MLQVTSVQRNPLRDEQFPGQPVLTLNIGQSEPAPAHSSPNTSRKSKDSSKGKLAEKSTADQSSVNLLNEGSAREEEGQGSHQGRGASSEAHHKKAQGFRLEDDAVVFDNTVYNYDHFSGKFIAPTTTRNIEVKCILPAENDEEREARGLDLIEAVKNFRLFLLHYLRRAGSVP